VNVCSARPKGKAPARGWSLPLDQESHSIIGGCHRAAPVKPRGEPMLFKRKRICNL
jgi:hypothetical protein